MSVQPHTIRQRIASALSGLTGWRESVWVPGVGMDAATASKVYSVEVPESEVIDPRQRRSAMQSGGDGVRTATSVRVRLVQRIQPDAQVDSYDAAIATEATARSLIAGGVWTGTTPIVLDKATRELAAEGTLLVTTITGTVHHLM